jgi:uracil phosphoribosyltransferase
MIENDQPSIAKKNDEFEHNQMSNNDSEIKKFKELIGREVDSIFRNGNAYSFHLWKYNPGSKIRYVDVIQNKSGVNVQVYFSKTMENSLDRILSDIQLATGLGSINNNRDYISSKNCSEQSAYKFLEYILKY